MFEPGDAIAGKYKVTRLLGEGGMGSVYEAHHEALGVAVAVKILKDDAMADAEAVARFAREAKAAAVLRGPHTARVFDVGELSGGRPFMVMEMLQGHDLGVELEQQRRIPLSQAASYVVQSCDAISEAHEIGIVHRDLKPANIFLARAGSRTVVKILDFGISRFDKAGEQRVTQTQSAFGTPLYMSPEAIRSAKHTDARSDIWALGVILYELVSGEPPFMGDTPTSVAVSITVDTYRPLSELVAGIPPEIDEIIARALQKDPTKRFQTVGEMSQALAPFADATPRTSLPGPVSSRSTEVMPARSISSEGRSLSPLSSKAYVLDTGRQAPSTLARTTLDRPPPEKSRSGVAMIAIGVAGALGVAGGLAFFLLQRAGEPATPSPAISSVASAEAADKRPGPNEPHVDTTVAPTPVSAQASAVVTSEPTASAASASARPSAVANPALPASAPPPPGTSAPKKTVPLAPSAPGGNPLIL
jgi:eukaryotic-like serine/threonine-protein kinase